MNLSSRLKKIVELLPTCELLADVGCDHGMVGMTALLQNKAKKVIFIDISQPSLKKAEILAKKNRLLDRTSFVVGDGLAGHKVDCAVIAGMGGKEILKILDDAKDCLPNNLLLNPMRNVDTVRSKLIENYFIDYDQKFFDKKFYDIMLLTRGKDNLTLPQIKYGKTNLEFFCNDFCNFLQEERKKYGKILEINDSQEIKLYLKELDELLNRSKNAG